ncbi:MULTISPECIES: hypothetical protein [Catenuloplanes]|uniref:Uncharacterized protein n=1 Tax=Catenuloplanes niger TaxID=587534 RepID=A0AAE3ZZL5_9ACTN|nr:hypothetical protein [Catenuloplanes niger]MDR7326858.1 hypothetical protein [Catenuloplanes niger]
MARYPTVPLPAGEPRMIAGQVRSWVTAPPMRDLVAAFGGELPAGEVGKLLGWLDDFSAAHWDFRRAGGVERDQVRSPHFHPETTATVREAATALGLAEHRRPRHARYDHVLVLGGLGRACLQRVAHAAELLRSGVAATEVAALGSFRPLSAAERAEPGLAGAVHEVDAMEVAVRASFGFPADPFVDRATGPIGHDSWAIRTFPAATGTAPSDTAAPHTAAPHTAAPDTAAPDTAAPSTTAPDTAGAPAVHVLAAPSSEPEKRRAHTPDTYEFWAHRFAVRPGDRILVVTSPIYVPFQHCDAIRMLGLPYRCEVDTVGFDPARAVPPQPATATATDRYLQETRSAILSMQRLLAAADAT